MAIQKPKKRTGQLQHRYNYKNIDTLLSNIKQLIFIVLVQKDERDIDYVLNRMNQTQMYWLKDHKFMNLSPENFNYFWQVIIPILDNFIYTPIERIYTSKGKEMTPKLEYPTSPYSLDELADMIKETDVPSDFKLLIYTN
jgi:hypothetical protein